MFNASIQKMKLNDLTLCIFRKVLAEKFIMTAAKLIAPSIESSFAIGFDWFVAALFNFNILTLEGRKRKC